MYLAKISTTLYVCIRGARETISYSTFSLDMLAMEMLLHTVTIESVLEIRDLHIRHTRCLQKNGAVSKINKKLISHLTRAKRTPSAAATVQVSHALPAVRFSCLMRGRGASFQDGVAAGKGFLCAPF